MGASSESPLDARDHEIVKTWHGGGSVVGAVCKCGREGEISEIQEHILLAEEEGDERV